MNAPSTTAAAHWDQMYESATRSAWTQNPLVERELYRRMTGQTGFWLEWVFTDGMRPVNRLLSVGCGDGHHEIMIARRGFAKHVTAFDASSFAIEQAGTVAAVENLAIDFSVRLFEQFVADPGPEASYDAVLFSGSLHHVLDLEGMLSAVRQVLKPGGLIIVNEYCGPCYQLYSKAQVDLVNRVLDSLNPRFLFEGSFRLQLPTMDMIMASDPTEGVRASLIPLLVPMYFKPQYERFVGGALLHPLFGCLNGTQINDGSSESDALVRMLIVLENELTSNGQLPHEFMFGIYRRE